jgi:hypothetical protein
MILLIHVKYKLWHATKNYVQLVLGNYENFQLHVSFTIENQSQMIIV